jgi:hypothetical protein
MNGIIEMEIQPGTAAAPEDAVASLQSECELWKEADKALAAALDKDCDNLGRIFRKLKKKCLAPGRDGKGWAAQLKERGLKVRTVDCWIQRHEELHSLRPKPVASVARGCSQRQENNGVTESWLEAKEWIGTHGSVAMAKSDMATYLPSDTSSSPEEKDLEWQVSECDTTMDLDTPEGRYNYMYRAATKVFVYRGGATKMLDEWTKISADITKMLQSFKIQDGGAILPRKEDI